MKCNPANPQEGGKIDIWEETYPVRFGAIDKSDRLTLDTVFNYFQEAAISHAENLGVGREAMAQTGQGWVLSRLTVLINRRPKYCETITVRSWPRGGEKLFAMRNFDIRDKDNIPVVAAKSAWIIVDIEKRRPLRPQFIMDQLPQNDGIDTIPSEANAVAGLPERGNLTKAAEQKALYTDIDFNGHVNNVSYIKWIEDTLDPLLLENADKIRMDINYLSEVLLGEDIELLSAKIEDTDCDHAFAFEGRRKENGQAAFRAELRLSSCC
ncbi:MAG: acyl-ACP thioesterase [Treponema sp.]|jgi:acyl-ACP thioesterase|nr:acyl-ACP thioesterase [Treponema sp.]